MLRSLIALLTFAALPLGAIAQYSDTTPKPAAATASPSGPRITYNHVNADGPYIALTFDDGPGKTTTPKLLDLLAKRGVKVTERAQKAAAGIPMFKKRMCVNQ